MIDERRRREVAERKATYEQATHWKDSRRQTKDTTNGE